MAKGNLAPGLESYFLSEVLGVIGLLLLFEMLCVISSYRRSQIVLSIFHFRASLIGFLKHLSE